MLDKRSVAVLDRLRAGAAHHDALARGHGDVARGTHRLAVAALHAGIDFIFHLRVELEVLHVLAFVVGDDHARVHHPARVGGALELHHHLVELVAVLAAHVRRHDAPGAVLGLEVAAGPQDQVNHVLVEPVVAVQVVVAFEAVGDEEVDVAVLGVAEDDGVVVAVGVEKLLQPAAGVGEVAHRDCNVFEQRGGAGWARLGHLGVKALAEGPGFRCLGGVGGERGRGLQVEIGQQLGARLLQLPQLLGLVGVVLNQQCRLAGQLEASDLLRHGVEGAPDGDGARVHQLERGRLRVEQRRQRARCRVQRRVHRDGGRLQPRHLDRAQHSLRDERKRALGSDQQVHEDVQRRVVIHERVQAVAHRVLQCEVLLDGGYRFLVLAHPPLQLLKLCDELRLLPRELRLRVLVRRIDHGAGREHKGHGLDGVVGVELRAAGHARRVVRNHAAQRGRALGRGVRPNLAAVRREVRVDLAHRRTRLDTHALAAVEDLHAAEVLAHVHEHARTAGLAGQRGAAGSQHHRGAGGRRGPERGRHVVGRAGLHHHVRGVEEVGRVVGVLDAVDGAGGKRVARAELAGQVRGSGGNSCSHRAMLSLLSFTAKEDK